MYKTCFPILDAILDALRGTCGPTALTKHYLHLVETKCAENTVEAVAKQFGIDLDGEASDFHSAIDLYAAEAERQGFINGFQMASLLTGECGGSVSAKAGFIGGLDYPHNFGEDKDAGVFEMFLRKPDPNGITFAFDPNQGVYTAVPNSGTAN